MKDSMILGVALGFGTAFAMFFAFSMGMTHERRNIQDYGGFTQEWSSIKWQCTPVKEAK